MPYVVTDHNNQDFVILGPIEWKPRYMADIISDETGQKVTIINDDIEMVPYDILPGIRIRYCNVATVHQENYDERIHHIQGPVWTYNNDGSATATWHQADKNIDLVKGELKNIIAANRYKKETSGFIATIQDKKVHIDTSRERRDAFQSKYLVLSEEEVVNWKFSNGILPLSKSEILNVMSSINSHIQGCFDWETNKIAEINSCTTLEELISIELRTNPEESLDAPPEPLENF